MGRNQIEIFNLCLPPFSRIGQKRIWTPIQFLFWFFDEYPIQSLIRKKLDTLEEAGLGNSASHVTTVTHVSAADEEEDWDNDDFFIDCVVTTQGEEKGNPAQIKNEPDEEVIEKFEKLETVSDQPAKKIKTSIQPRIEKPSFRETVKIKTSPKKAKRKSNSLVQNSKKKLKKSVNNALDELADTGGFKF